MEVKRIQHHQTSLATNTKGIYIASKHKRKERPTKTNPPQIKKIPVGTCVSIITLNVNGLHALTKNADWLNGYKTKTHIYAASRRSTSDLETYADWKQKDGKDIPCEWKPKESCSGNLYFRQNRL